MGRRSETRIAKRAPVLVHGTGPTGSTFAAPALLIDISGAGASLTGLNGVGLPGRRVELEYQGRKARYRIQWVGKDGTKRANQVGLRSLEPGSFIWGVQLPDWSEDTFDPGHLEDARAASIYRSGNGSTAKGRERRVFMRHTCRIEAIVTIEGTDLSSPTIVSDLTLGGCYLEMLSPFPMSTLVELKMNPGNTTLHVHGQVRTSPSGMGMGISFTGLTPEDFEKLRKLAPPDAAPPKPASVASPPKTATAPTSSQPTIAAALPAPAISVSPPATEAVDSEFEFSQDLTHSDPGDVNQSAVAGQPSTADALEAIVRALFRKGVLSRSEVDEELRKLMTVKSS
jgi:hypothetical protein